MIPLFILLIQCFVLCCCGGKYILPEPKFELLYPKGFSVKIPHSDGISVFAFHGKINEKMDLLEAGKFSRDVYRRTGNFWIFEDRNTNLRVGDKIYFWLFVIKDSLGYRFDNGEFVVKEDTPFRTDGIQQETATVTPRGSSTPFNNATKANEVPDTAEPIAGNSTLKNITDALLALRSEVNSLKEVNGILKEISEKHPESARRLKVGGRIPANEDALVAVKGIVKQKLLLTVEIARAERNRDGSITFETSSLDEKVKIIRAAKEELKYSRIYLTY